MLDPVFLSAIEHYSYCPRQCGLIHMESIYDENLLTLKGSLAHERVHEQTTRKERGKTILRGLPLWSEKLGIVGFGDAIEFEKPKHFLPIEYKVGKKTDKPHAKFQACAQAMCLEEMFNVTVPKAAVFFIASNERVLFELDEDIRSETLRIIEQIRMMNETLTVPPPVADSRCRNCSLFDACMPFAVHNAKEPKMSIFNPLPKVDLP